MKFAGWQRTSLIDFPGMISSVLFTQGCSMRCRFCHNPELVLPDIASFPPFSEEEILAYLIKRRSMIEGVVITGGEPTLQPTLPDFVQKLHSLGFAIKLDTNGYQPQKLEELLETGCINYVAMDIKAPLYKYSDIAGIPIDPERIQKSLSLLASSSLPYELRTTAVKPLMSLDDLLTIAKEIKGAPLWFIQQFRSGCTLDPALRNQEGYKEEELQHVARIVCPSYVKKCRTRLGSLSPLYEVGKDRLGFLKSIFHLSLPMSTNEIHFW